MNRLLLVLGLSGLLLTAACSKKATLDELRAAGKKAFLAQDYAGARQFLVQAIGIAPSDRELLYLTGEAYRRDFKYDSAMVYFKRLDLLYPDDREANAQIYEVAKAAERWEDAIHAIYVLARTGDGYERYYGELSDLWTRSGSFINGLYWARKAIALDPQNIAAYVGGAFAASQCDSIDAAITITDSAIARFGEDIRLLANMGTFLAQRGQYDTAERFLRQVIAVDSTTAAYRMSLAHTLVAQNNKSKKREALGLYKSIQSQVGPEFQIDSIITSLEEELK
jgi:tetratricopeptide (TPR) repeat protein